MPPADPSLPITPLTPIVFIGGGHMARAIVGGLCRSGVVGDAIVVIDPAAAQRDGLRQAFSVRTAASAEEAGALLSAASIWVWAVKPQAFAAAAPACRPFGRSTVVQLSVMAGVRTGAIAQATGAERVVRAMPNTPALIGQGIAGLFARAAVGAAERGRVEEVLAATGRLVWVDAEEELDAVTAISGSGPAYGFYLLEAMVDAAQRMGMPAERGLELALATLEGSMALARASGEPPAVLRAQVTSKGGTTQAATEWMDQREVKTALVEAMQAAQRRARELGDELSPGA